MYMTMSHGAFPRVRVRDVGLSQPERPATLPADAATSRKAIVQGGAMRIGNHGNVGKLGILYSVTYSG